MKLRVPFLLALGLPLAIAAAAPAVIMDAVNGAGNIGAPSSDPGWSYVGSCNGLSCVYLGDGWVLTANHVGPGDAYFENVLYPWVIGSDVRLSNPDNSYADLLMFRIEPPYPPLPDVPIASVTASSDSQHPLYLIGNGRNRGDETSWDPYPGPPPSSIGGYDWGAGAAKRWGTNQVEIAPYFESYFATWVFGTDFDELGGSESQAAVGDSGGAAFAWNGTSYELAGILIGIGTYVFPTNPPTDPPTYIYQRAETALYGNATYAADLSVYRDEIVATMPEPVGGLWTGAALLAILASAGTRRACRGTGCAASSPPRA